MVAVAALVIGVGRVLFALSPNVFGSVFMFLYGFPGPAMSVAFRAIYHNVVPEELRGRVYRWRYVIDTAIMRLGVAADGPLVNAVGTRLVLLIVGAVAPGSGLLSLLSRLPIT